MFAVRFATVVHCLFVILKEASCKIGPVRMETSEILQNESVDFVYIALGTAAAVCHIIKQKFMRMPTDPTKHRICGSMIGLMELR